MFFECKFPWTRDAWDTRLLRNTKGQFSAWRGQALSFQKKSSTHCSLSAWRALGADVSSLLLVSDVVSAKEAEQGPASPRLGKGGGWRILSLLRWYRRHYLIPMLTPRAYTHAYSCEAQEYPTTLLLPVLYNITPLLGCCHGKIHYVQQWDGLEQRHQ